MKNLFKNKQTSWRVKLWVGEGEDKGKKPSNIQVMVENNNFTMSFQDCEIVNDEIIDFWKMIRNYLWIIT